MEEGMTGERIKELARDFGFRWEPVRWPAYVASRKGGKKELVEDAVCGFVLHKVPAEHRGKEKEGLGAFVYFCSDTFSPLPNEIVLKQANEIAREREAQQVFPNPDWHPDRDWYLALHYERADIGWAVENAVDGTSLLRVTPFINVNGTRIAVPEVRTGKSMTARKHTGGMFNDISNLKALVNINIQSAEEWATKFHWLKGQPVNDKWVSDIKKLGLPAKVLPKWLVDGTEPEGDLMSNYIELFRQLWATVTSDKRRLDLMRPLALTIEKQRLVETLLE